jgi:hypothetical protein
MSRPRDHHETVFQPDSPKPAARCGWWNQVAILADVGKSRCRAQLQLQGAEKSGLSETEELDEERGLIISLDKLHR